MAHEGTVTGIDSDRFCGRFGVGVEDLFGDALRLWEGRGLSRTERGFAPHGHGRLLQNPQLRDCLVSLDGKAGDFGR